MNGRGSFEQTVLVISARTVGVTMDYRSNRLMIIAFVGLLIMGTITIFIMMQAVGNLNPDPHIHNDDYVFEGTLNGYECTGKGVSEYSNETSAEYLYSVTYILESLKEKESFQFGIFFKLDESMDPRYYQDMGTEELDGETVHVWKRAESDTTYTFWVGQYCTVMKMHIQSDRVDVIGNIVKK